MEIRKEKKNFKCAKKSVKIKGKLKSNNISLIVCVCVCSVCDIS